jgi:hypothetical protein
VSSPSAARIDALRSTVVRLREGFHRRGNSTSSSSSEGCGSSLKRSSGSVDAMQNSNFCTNDSVSFGRSNSCQEGTSHDKNLSEGGCASLAQRSSSCRSVLQDPDILVSDLTSVSTAISSNNQLLDLNLAAVFQEKLNDPRITSMLKKRGAQGDIELINLLRDKGLDPNFAYMLKEKGLDPKILSLLQRSSLDADRDHGEDPEGATIIDVADSERLDATMNNQISLSEELRRNGFENWLYVSRFLFHQIAGSPERALVLFTVVFVAETLTLALHRPLPVKVINATHEQVIIYLLVASLPPNCCLCPTIKIT